ncbi:hypothetical protein ACFE33_15250 (plasmid) [Falsihalocynthiibacter sp. SS001]|uniref:hypothetical protein n=1 Tax=Falsihalocynthiibacter sp. SS001 TaxID=3349698 RepID=UPI0036D2423E
MFCDFTTGMAAIDGQSVPIESVFQCTRSTVGRLADGTHFAPDTLRRSSRGLLIEEARENYFLNSFAPATQSIALAAGTYTASVGTGGSVAISGDATLATASSQSFTLAQAGTITVTISGAPQWVQVENGPFASSPIPTNGAASTRADDFVVPLDLGWFSPENMTFSIEWEQRQSGAFAQNGVSNVVRWAGDAGYSRIRAGSTSFAQIRNQSGALGLNSGVGGATAVGIHTMTLTTSGETLQIAWSDSFNGTSGSATSTDGPAADHVTSLYLGSNATSEFLNGWIRKITVQ